MNSLSNEGPIRRFFHERMKNGPILRKLREKFFKAGTEIIDALNFDSKLINDISNAKALVVIISPLLHLAKVKKFIDYDKFKNTLKKELK